MPLARCACLRRPRASQARSIVNRVVPPGAWLGLLGGGQLGRMFCMAAQSLGYKVAVLDPADSGPAASVADRHIRGDYADPRCLADLAALAGAATTEFENVPATALLLLARDIRVPPRRINEIVHRKRAITADTALRLARYFSTSERFWLNLQSRYDLEVEKDKLGNRLRKEVAVLARAG